MTHKEILEQTKSELDRLVSEAKRKLDELNLLKLAVGKWYKDTEEENNLLIYITDIKDNEIVGYGFNVLGKWVVPNTGFYSGNMESAYRFLVEATDQEVEAALVKEAIRRGFTDGVTINISNLSNHFPEENIKIKGSSFMYKDLMLGFGYNNYVIFKDGKWAEVIKENRTTLDQYIKALKDKYPNLKFTITVEDNL